MRGFSILPVALAAVLGGLSGCTTEAATHDAVAVKRQQTGFIPICHGYECPYKAKLYLSGRDASRLSSIMAKGRGSPEAERRAVGAAIVYFEQRTAALLQHRDTPMTQFANSRVRGEMDCLDEAANSHALLAYLESRKLLKHHKVVSNISRGFLVDNQFPHAAAALRDAKGETWAIDSWPVPVGSAPEIMTASKWRASGNLGRELNAALQ